MKALSHGFGFHVRPLSSSKLIAEVSESNVRRAGRFPLFPKRDVIAEGDGRGLHRLDPYLRTIAADEFRALPESP